MLPVDKTSIKWIADNCFKLRTNIQRFKYLTGNYIKTEKRLGNRDKESTHACSQPHGCLQRKLIRSENFVTGKVDELS